MEPKETVEERHADLGDFAPPAEEVAGTTSDPDPPVDVKTPSIDDANAGVPKSAADRPSRRVTLQRRP